MVDFVSALQRESARFGELVHNSDLGSGVPSCPDWTLADLAWHLTEVQQFWGEIAGRLLADPGDVARIARPDDAELGGLFDTHAAALLDAVTRHAPDAECWSWDPHGGTIAWVRRRQAQEALVHRIDAELAAGAAHDPIDPGLAADGVDEILRVMMSGVPKWGDFTPDGRSVALVAVDTGHRWDAVLGRFTGASPSTGTTYDEESLDVTDDPIDEVTTTISAAAADLDLWLWGRRDARSLTIAGEPSVADYVRTVAALSTQ